MKKPSQYVYPAILTYYEGQEIAVWFPDLDVATSGIDEEDAFFSARDLLGTVMNGLEEDNEQIPEPSQLKDISVKENEKIVLVDVYMPSIRLARENRSVSRTVTLPAWLNALAVEKNINFSATLQKAIKDTLKV